MEQLLERIRKTNPEITEQKLMKELRKSNYSTIKILTSMENIKRVEG